jgi:hypothetical protein
MENWHGSSVNVVPIYLRGSAQEEEVGLGF